MYNELIKRLRDAAKIYEWAAILLPDSKGSATAELYKEAADAIEELSKFVNIIRRLKSDGWYLQQAKNHDGYKAITTMPLPEPSKEE